MNAIKLKSCASLATLFSIVLVTTVPFLVQAQSWKKLFNGKSLQGWHQLPGGKWEVKNGMIVGTSKKTEERHGLLITNKRYKDFTVHISYKSVRGNSGLYFRVDEVGGDVGVNGFQAEIDPQKDAGGLYETGGREWVVKPEAEDVKRWYKPGSWNTMKVTAREGNISVFVNGILTAKLENDPGRKEGYIALQLHGGTDMEVYFKNIMVKEF